MIATTARTSTTLPTIDVDHGSAFRVGLSNKLGREELERDLSASSKEPNAAYDGPPGHMIDFDVNPSDASAAKVQVREHKADTIGRLLGQGGCSHAPERRIADLQIRPLRRLSGPMIHGSHRPGNAQRASISWLDCRS